MPKRHSTLAVFLQALQGTKVIIESQRDSIIRGVLESVDQGLNCVMKDVVIKDVYGRTREAPSLHIRASAIRYVHLPPSIEPSQAVKTHRKRLAAARRENYTKQQQQQPRLPKGAPQ